MSKFYCRAGALLSMMSAARGVLLVLVVVMAGCAGGGKDSKKRAEDRKKAQPETKLPPLVLDATLRADDDLDAWSKLQEGRPRKQCVPKDVESIAFSPKWRRFATGHKADRDPKVRIWEAASGRLLHTLLGHKNWNVNSVAFSPDGRMLASGGTREVLIWDVGFGLLLRTLSRPDIGNVQSVAFSPDGRLLATGGHEVRNDHDWRPKTMCIWELASGRLLRSWKGHSSVNLVAFSPDGRLLAAAGEDETVRIWETATGRILRTLRGHSKRGVWSVAFSPDGRLLASMGYDAKVRIWEAATGRLLRTLRAHSNDDGSIAFSPDGRLLALGPGFMQRVYVWDVASGRRCELWSPYSGGVWMKYDPPVAFSADGRLLAFGAHNKTVYIWGPNPPQTILVAGKRIDWRSPKEDESPPRLEYKVQGLPSTPIEPGKPLKVSLEVTNRGPGSAYRLVVFFRFPDKKPYPILFGHIASGGSMTRTVTIPSPAQADGKTQLKMVWKEGNGHAPAARDVPLVFLGPREKNRRDPASMVAKAAGLWKLAIKDREYEAALEYLRTLQKYDPENPLLKGPALALTCLRLGQYRKALDLAAGIFERKPVNSEAVRIAAAALKSLMGTTKPGSFPKAIKARLLNFWKVAVAARELEPALQFLAAIERYDPGNPLLRDAPRVLTYLRIGLHRQAYIEARKILARDPTHVPAVRHAGKALRSILTRSKKFSAFLSKDLKGTLLPLFEAALKARVPATARVVLEIIKKYDPSNRLLGRLPMVQIHLAEGKYREVIVQPRKA